MLSVVYVTGTRADFGLMESALKRVNEIPKVDLSLIVTGMHLSRRYGLTKSVVTESGLKVIAELRVPLEPETGATMAKAMASCMTQLTDVFAKTRPNLLLLLGDRGEMLAAALVALHLGIRVAHIHGGERSGTIDESIRHAITKLSHIHFVATEESRTRLVSMGEDPNSVLVTGAPGLDDFVKRAQYSLRDIKLKFNIVDGDAICVLIFHPVVQLDSESTQQIGIVLAALETIRDLHIIAIAPNSDAGSREIRSALESRQGERFGLYRNLDRSEFASLIKCCDVLVGNSSSGIIESACFGVPTVNIGSRQRLRQRNDNVVDVALNEKEIHDAVVNALGGGKYRLKNVYGDGTAGEKLVTFFETLEIDSWPLEKVLTY